MEGNRHFVAVSPIFAGLLYLHFRMAIRQRVWAGLISFVAGWGGIFLGVSLSERPFLQSESVAMVWVSVCGAFIVAAVVLLVPATSEWLPRNRRRRTTKET